jgi:hypothetical protein
MISFGILCTSGLRILLYLESNSDFNFKTEWLYACVLVVKVFLCSFQDPERSFIVWKIKLFLEIPAKGKSKMKEAK